MNTLETYLQQKNFASATIYQHVRYCREFLEWLEAQQISPEDCSYNDLLSWIDYLKGQRDSIKLVNRKLLSVRYFFSFQLKKEAINPAAGFVFERQQKAAG